MKKIILLISFLFSLSSFAQVIFDQFATANIFISPNRVSLNIQNRVNHAISCSGWIWARTQNGLQRPYYFNRYLSANGFAFESFWGYPGERFIFANGSMSCFKVQN